MSSNSMIRSVRFFDAVVAGFAAVMFLSSCASLTAESGSGTYHEASYNDGNRAPASFAPKMSFQEGGTLDPMYLRTQADYYFSVGEAFSLESKHEKAIESFKLVQVYDPNSAQVCLRLAAEYVKLGLIAESLEQAELAVKKDPKNVEAKILLGGLYSTVKQYPRAVEQYQEALRLEPNNTDAPLYLGAVYAEQKQFDKSVKFFEALAKNDDYATPHIAYFYIGRIRLEQDGLAAKKAAEAAFKKALEIKPGHVDSVLALGGLYLKLSQEEKAVQLYKSFQKEQGANPRVAEVLSQHYIDHEQYDLAYDQLEVLENSSDDSLNIKVKMALILIEQKKYKPAIDKLQDILKQVPESDKIQFYLAAIYEEIDQKSKAIEYFSKIPSTSSFFSESMVHATYLLKSEQKIDDALSLAKTAFDARKDLPQMYAVYASLLDEKKEYKKAEDVLTVGLQKFPEQVQLWFFMGTIQDRLGQKEQVITNMKQVVELDPNHVQGLNYLAFTYADQGGNLEEAERLVKRALTLEPADGYILDTMGWVNFKKGRFDEAVRYLEAAQRSQPQESIIAEHLGDAYRKSQLIDKAKKMYQKAAELEVEEPKVKEIRAKITSLEKQETPSSRLPASEARSQGK